MPLNKCSPITTMAGIKINGVGFGKKSDLKAALSEKVANVCYSMVNGDSEEAIIITHTFSADAYGVLKGKDTVPKPNLIS